MTNGSAAKYSIPPPPPSNLLYDNEDDIEDEDHYYRWVCALFSNISKWDFWWYLGIALLTLQSPYPHKGPDKSPRHIRDMAEMWLEGTESNNGNNYCNNGDDDDGDGDNKDF